MKVVSGKISTDSQLVNMRTGNTERVGKTVMLVGKKQVDVKYIGAGDIGAIPKLTATNTGDTLCSPTPESHLGRGGVSQPHFAHGHCSRQEGRGGQGGPGHDAPLRRGPHLAV